MNLTKQFFYSTIKIDINLNENIFFGTGFFYQFNSLPNEIFIVTNRHVAEIKGTGIIKFHASHTTNDIKKVTIPNINEKFIFHPDPEIDLAIARLSDLTTEKISTVFISESSIPSESEISNMNYIEDIVFVGYPEGRLDIENNTPIVRSGITATPIQQNYNQQPIFLIDSPVYGGSSGSPVFLYNNGAYADVNGNVNLGTRVFFLGIVAKKSHHTYPILYDNNNQAHQISNLISESDDNNTFVINNPHILIETGLGFVIKSSQLQGFLPLLQND